MRMTRSSPSRSPLLLAALLATGSGACSQSDELLERTVTSVDPAGGVARSTDGVATLRFPAGALDVTTEITMLTRRDRSDPALRSLVYELGPAGLTFAVPVTLTVTPADGTSRAAVARVEDARITALPGSTWDVVGRSASAPLDGVASYAAVATASAALDGGVEPDSGLDPSDPNAGNAGGPCWSSAECPRNWTCLFWEDQCRIGRCDPACPTTFDASVITVCGCDGVARVGQPCTDFPIAHRSGSDGGGCTVWDAGPWSRLDAGS